MGVSEAVTCIYSWIMPLITREMIKVPFMIFVIYARSIPISNGSLCLHFPRVYDGT